MVINVLGTEYTIEHLKREDDKMFNIGGADGYCDSSSKRIVLRIEDEKDDFFDELKDIDTIFITCRQETTKDSNTLFIKTMEDMVLDADGYLHCKFDPSDTENLYYGDYYFDIEVTLTNGFRKTVLHKFTLTQETTIHGGTDGN